jgi:hypothetical protein
LKCDGGKRHVCQFPASYVGDMGHFPIGVRAVALRGRGPDGASTQQGTAPRGREAVAVEQCNNGVCNVLEAVNCEKRNIDATSTDRVELPEVWHTNCAVMVKVK